MVKRSNLLNLAADEAEEEVSNARPRKSFTPAELEQLYDDTSGRILQERNDFFLPQICDFIQQKKWVNLRPEYQRRRRWDKKKQSRLIESLLMNVPVPPIFLYETDLNRYEVMDGQQRLISITEFYNGKLELKSLRAWSGLNGFRYRELPQRLKRGLDRRRLSAVILLAESGSPGDLPFADIRREVFERLNTGGTALNQQELRNSIYGGPFNDLIVDLARAPLFCKLWDIPSHGKSPSSVELEKLQENDLYSKMADCQIVLRFFAFRETEHVRGSVKNMLDSCMKRYQKIDKSKTAEFRNLFLSRLKLVHELLGADAFRLPETRGGRHSRPLFDALMVACDRLWEHAGKLRARKGKVRTEVQRLLNDNMRYAFVIGRPNTAKAVRRRINLMERALRSVL